MSPGPSHKRPGEPIDQHDNVSSRRSGEVDTPENKPEQSPTSAGRAPRSPRPRLSSSDTRAFASPFRNLNREGQPVSSPHSHSSDSPFSQLSPGVVDRVFPIRSVVSVDPTQTPMPRNEGAEFPDINTSDTSRSSSRPAHTRKSSIANAPSSPHDADPMDARRRLKEAFTGGASSISSSEGTGPSGRAPGPTFSGLEAQRRNHPKGSSLENAPNLINSATGAVPSNDGMSGAASVRSGLGQDGAGVVTARFKHVVTAEGHAIITGRDGDTLQRCEDEPIHIPGAIQAFGLLIALREQAGGKLAVRIVSENSKTVIGYSPKALFELENFCDILSEEQADNLLDHIDFIREDESDPASAGPEVFVMSIRAAALQRPVKLWCAMHVNRQNPDLIICEFELDDDPMYPLVPVGEATPEPPEDTLSSAPTDEELAESTINLSKPLRVLRSARKRKGEAAAMEVFNIMAQVQEQLASAPSLDVFLKVLVGVVKELTGFHRVMVYQFDQSWNGRVVTELLDPRATKDLYKGLNFPASDIPRQARELYKVNKVRLLYDRDQETARLVCRTSSDLETPLDLTYSYLRAMSPIHIKYLANMAVRSSMSISINAFDELWGLISCHSYGSKGMRVSFPIRKMCRLIGDTASRNIERLSYASRLQARKLINTAPSEKNPSGYIIASSDDLLKLFDADFGLLSIRDETKTMGKMEHSQEALAMLEYLRMRKVTSVLTSQDLKEDFPDLRYEPGFQVIAGLLLVPLSAGGEDFIVFFRRGQLKEVKWAGNPYEKFVKEGTEGYLEPRKSFKTWSEVIAGRCREWTEEQIETAAVLCLVYGKFIEVWRQKEAALQNSQLTRLLLANSAHEVRTPLNAIINYLEIALEGAIDQETRENLSKSHSASKSLIYVINDLLDLTKTEEGHNLVKDEDFDLIATVREAMDMFNSDAKRKNIEYGMAVGPGVPVTVVGDQRRVRQAISNLIANAIKHTSSGRVKVELSVTNAMMDQVETEIAVEDTGSGMSGQKLDALFRELEQVRTEGDDLFENEVNDPGKRLGEGNDDNDERRALGLGLALVARVIRNMNGQLRLKSEEGKGSRFVVQLPFFVPSPQKQLDNTSSTELAPVPGPTTPPVADGEVLLVTRASGGRTPGASPALNRHNSAESVDSFQTTRSHSSNRSATSEVDRLINAMQEPVGQINATPSGRLDRTGSKGSLTSADRPSSASSSFRGHASRHHSFDSFSTYDQHSPTRASSGRELVLDSGTPIKPVRIPEEPSQGEAAHSAANSSSASHRKLNSTLAQSATPPPTANHLNVLVAEDDPLNSKIVKKRLEKSGHVVHLTVNGEECSSKYGENAAAFDVILMDMQMPIVDGLSATKMIRSGEKSSPSRGLSARAALNGRVPIFAVSASLVERNRQQYVDAGFDGWILKPIDFKRVTALFAGLVDHDTRAASVYRANCDWEKGGWFHKRQPDVFSANTVPCGSNPVTRLSPQALSKQEALSRNDTDTPSTSVSSGTEDGHSSNLLPSHALEDRPGGSRTESDQETVKAISPPTAHNDQSEQLTGPFFSSADQQTASDPTDSTKSP
ncbi:MAG: Light-sensor Protein kinase [Piccolia ochrophora]|nr:MAG: Light-sensor Protein kinase [Piccolia ochrophora]